MRFGRVRVQDEVHWAEFRDDSCRLLDGSPLAGAAHAGREIAIDAVELLPPVIPGVFYAVGYNYGTHIAHAQELGDAIRQPTRPEVGYRANNALTGHGSPILMPPEVTGRFEAEGEVVAVIGRRLSRATRAEAQESVFGWTVGNDVSARTWQHADRTFWRSKNSDTFKPMGPWIETDVDPMAQTTTVTVNRETRAQFRTGDMIFDPWDFLVEASRYCTFEPGDVLWMGAESTCQLSVGDTVEIDITGIGTLSNPVVAAEPLAPSPHDLPQISHPTLEESR